jgi:hypothetical protein
MKIIFDVRRTGLGNNGGSATIINCANTLCSLGNTVIILDSMKNLHTWTPLEAAHIISKNDKDIPQADAIIATGFKSVEPTVNAPSSAGRKFHYMRGWETWVYSEDDIIKNILNQPTIKIVNGIQLYNTLQNYEISSYMIRPGYDIDKFSNLNIRNRTKYVVIGGLYHSGSKASRKRTNWIYETVTAMKTKYKNIKLWMFGPENDPKNPIIDKYIKSPNMKLKNEIYNTVHIWLAPTMLEGLHMPPAEAMLTECFIVGTNTKLSGMEDYLENNMTGAISDDNLSSFINTVDYYIENSDVRNIIGKQARNKILELGDRKENMKKLVSLLHSF